MTNNRPCLQLGYRRPGSFRDAETRETLLGPVSRGNRAAWMAGSDRKLLYSSLWTSESSTDRREAQRPPRQRVSLPRYVMPWIRPLNLSAVGGGNLKSLSTGSKSFPARADLWQSSWAGPGQTTSSSWRLCVKQCSGQPDDMAALAWGVRCCRCLRQVLSS